MAALLNANRAQDTAFTFAMIVIALFAALEGVLCVRCGGAPWWVGAFTRVGARSRVRFWMQQSAGRAAVEPASHARLE
jgi:hypothetical protein